ASLVWAPALGLLAKTLLVSTVLFLTPRVGQETALVLYHRWLGIPFYLASLALAAAIAARIGITRPVRSSVASTA
ncbi:MAG: hypothetical protein HYY32_00280, partial [Chloroflexi bacterium]|nr:hypothetical protein [Chloroflexota bacterium]